jgi:peptide-methionine (S)-S-oxide reductase
VTGERESATLGGGCFWCLEAVFDEVEGVESVTSGYAGGHVSDPSYEAVCGGRTGHAEVVQVTFNPEVITYRNLLEIFFAIHDPTTLNRQGGDVGSQYRSIIFYHSDAQKRDAESVLKEVEGAWDAPVVTELVPFEKFYEAEAYHQDYFKRNPAAGYCRAVINPKLAKFRARFQGKLKT